jgi:hypothetical protein
MIPLAYYGGVTACQRIVAVMEYFKRREKYETAAPDNLMESHHRQSLLVLETLLPSYCEKRKEFHIAFLACSAVFDNAFLPKDGDAQGISS